MKAIYSNTELSNEFLKGRIAGYKDGFRFAMHGLCHEGIELVQPDNDSPETFCPKCLEMNLY